LARRDLDLHQALILRAQFGERGGRLPRFPRERLVRRGAQPRDDGELGLRFGAPASLVRSLRFGLRARRGFLCEAAFGLDA
jgi:hypothetical protein